MKIRNQLILILAVLFAFVHIANAQEKNTLNSEQPKVIKAVAPFYPAAAKVVRIEGNVTVDVEINSKGEVTSAVSTSGHPLLTTASVLSAKRWKFNAVKNKNLKRRVQIVFNYKIVLKEEESGIYFSPPYRIEIDSQKEQNQISDDSH